MTPDDENEVDTLTDSHVTLIETPCKQREKERALYHVNTDTKTFKGQLTPPFSIKTASHCAASTNVYNPIKLSIGHVTNVNAGGCDSRRHATKVKVCYRRTILVSISTIHE